MANEAVVAVMREAGHDAWTNSTSSWGPVLWNEIMRGALNGLEANGYVVVPEPLLRELLNAAHYKNINLPGGGGPRLSAARRAVVEAVGPTREDTK